MIAFILNIIYVPVPNQSRKVLSPPLKLELQSYRDHTQRLSEFCCVVLEKDFQRLHKICHVQIVFGYFADYTAGAAI